MCPACSSVFPTEAQAAWQPLWCDSDNCCMPSNQQTAPQWVRPVAVLLYITWLICRLGTTRAAAQCMLLSVTSLDTTARVQVTITVAAMAWEPLISDSRSVLLSEELHRNNSDWSSDVRMKPPLHVQTGNGVHTSSSSSVVHYTAGVGHATRRHRDMSSCRRQTVVAGEHLSPEWR